MMYLTGFFCRKGNDRLVVITVTVVFNLSLDCYSILHCHTDTYCSCRTNNIGMLLVLSEEILLRVC